MFVSLGQGTIAHVAVDLQHADEAVEMGHWPRGLAVRSIDATAGGSVPPHGRSSRA